MLGEDLDIGLYADDAYAAYVTDLATSLQIVPHCRNARGATLEVVFTGPFLDLPAYQAAVAQETLLPYSIPPCPIAESRGVQGITGSSLAVTLHGWIEKLNAARKVQLMEPLFPACELGETTTTMSAFQDVGNSGQPTFAASLNPDALEPACSASKNGSTLLKPSRYRIVGNLDFLLHLSSRMMPMGECGIAVDTPSEEKHGREGAHTSGDAIDAMRAARACRDVLEQRDDIELARNAVSTVIKVAQMVEEHPGEVGSVFVDTKERVEYIQFSA
ncbi:hypothetical protein JKF63_00402 [Porcisia hertigi]|uniref:Uncharacterized protein n=1 Tax=Porcisia hertigi TaxID=2761500 RepID=A0A836KYA7_9TRYP|nr:hypothetical protein JKF63_00402 [Porcisia hertigi]